MFHNFEKRITSQQIYFRAVFLEVLVTVQYISDSGKDLKVCGGGGVRGGSPLHK